MNILTTVLARVDRIHCSPSIVNIGACKVSYRLRYGDAYRTSHGVHRTACTLWSPSFGAQMLVRISTVKFAVCRGRDCVTAVGGKRLRRIRVHVRTAQRYSPSLLGRNSLMSAVQVHKYGTPIKGHGGNVSTPTVLYVHTPARTIRDTALTTLSAEAFHGLSNLFSV